METPSAVTKAKTPSVWEIYFPRRGPDHHGSIYLASFPEIIFFWPVILAAFFCAFLQGVLGLSGASVGWFFVMLMIFNFIVLVHDFDQKRFLIFILFVSVFWLLVWITNLYGFTFLKSFARWLLDFNPTISSDGYLLLGSFLLVLFCWGLISPLFDYWRIEPNEFVHYTQPVGRDLSIARANCSVSKEIPDVFECLLTGGGGSLVIKRDQQILATIKNIPFLGLRMAAIEHVLAETRVVVERKES